MLNKTILNLTVKSILGGHSLYSDIHSIQGIIIKIHIPFIMKHSMYMGNANEETVPTMNNNAHCIIISIQAVSILYFK